MGAPSENAHDLQDHQFQLREERKSMAMAIGPTRTWRANKDPTLNRDQIQRNEQDASPHVHFAPNTPESTKPTKFNRRGTPAPTKHTDPTLESTNPTLFIGSIITVTTLCVVIGCILFRRRPNARTVPVNISSPSTNLISPKTNDFIR